MEECLAARSWATRCKMPFRPNRDLIGCIEKGQKPAVRTAPPSEKR
jgi:hypothetical protein